MPLQDPHPTVRRVAEDIAEMESCGPATIAADGSAVHAVGIERGQSPSGSIVTLIRGMFGEWTAEPWADPDAGAEQ
ncbi:MAG: hypothetical protein V5A34_03240 [Halapricum sp.]